MNTSPGQPEVPQPGSREAPPGVVHTYLAYDPKNFPSPSAPPPDLASGAMEHLLAYGSLDELTEEDLARAVRIDPSLFPSLGPSLESIAARLRERKAKILATYETDAARSLAAKGVKRATRAARPPRDMRDRFDRIAKAGQIRDVERLWYEQRREDSPFALDLLHLMEALSDRYQVEQLAGKYAFTGREEMDVPKALEVKEELEAIDELLKQLEQAKKDATIGIIDLDSLAEIADPAEIESLNRLRQQVEEYLANQAREQGLEKSSQGLRLSPKAMRTFQHKLLRELFASLASSRSGRHEGVETPDGTVELARTRPWEFGDPASSIDLPATITNALLRQAGSGGGPLRLRGDDIETHVTRRSPRCATCVLMDMSGSMRYGGQYIHVKRMALALDALIRTEYPGDFLQFIELFTFAKARPVAEIPALMPKPVSISSPRVRLRVDMGAPDASELAVPQHFTNIQRGLQLARQWLAPQPTPNRQVILITDGLPTAHFEQSMLYLLYPPDPRTEEATLREAKACAKEGITINVFLLPSWSQTSEDVQFAHRMAESTKGRVLFTGGRDLDRFVVWDYVSQRRRIIGGG